EQKARNARQRSIAVAVAIFVRHLQPPSLCQAAKRAVAGGGIAAQRIAIGTQTRAGICKTRSPAGSRRPRSERRARNFFAASPSARSHAQARTRKPLSCHSERSQGIANYFLRDRIEIKRKNKSHHSLKLTSSTRAERSMCSLPTMKFNGPAGVAAGAGLAPAGVTGVGRGMAAAVPAAVSRAGPLPFWFLTWIAR